MNWKKNTMILIKLSDLLKQMRHLSLNKMSEVQKMQDENYRMFFKTVQSNAIKTLIEGLKDIIIDVNFKINSEGIQIIALDGKLVTMVHLKLVASSFEYFFCKHPITIGVNIKSMHILLKTVGNNDVITMFVDKTDITRLNIVNENKEKNMRDISQLKLLDINEDIYSIPNIEFDSVIKMPSNDFQKICKDLSNISDVVTIKNVGTQFIMSVEGDIGNKQIIIGETLSVEFNKISNDDFSGKFDIKYLLLFIKNSNLCTNIELFLKKDHPLILVYSVASLGSLKFVLAPKVSDDD